MEVDKNYIVGIFDDEDVLLDAVKSIREKGVNIHEVYTPFPVHGLDIALGYKMSRLPIAAFLFGLLGTTLALTMMFYMMEEAQEGKNAFLEKRKPDFQKFPKFP